jgi:HK97 family phage prohead protease
MPICKDREYRALLSPLSISAENKRIDSNYYVEGYATTFEPYLFGEDENGNKYYELIDRNAFAGTDMSDIIMQYDHNGKVLARNSNKTLGVEVNDKGFFMFADLSKSNAAKDLYEEISNGLITKMSWAFTIADWNYNKDTRTRTITKIKKVYDVSAVSIPANNDTEISARSFAQGRLEAEQQELLVRRIQILKLKTLLED